MVDMPGQTLTPRAVVIREAVRDDCEAVTIMVWRLAALSGVTSSTRAATLRDVAFGEAASIGILVAEAGDGLAGYLLHQDTFSTYRGGNGLFVVDLYVEPDWRNEHLGQRLLQAAAALARRSGALFMRLDVDAENRGAQRFYQRLGFQRSEHNQTLSLEARALAELAGA